jgi:hypothetical protein
MFTMGLTCGCTCVHDDVGVDVVHHPMTQGEPSTVFGNDDEEHIVRCLQNVNGCLIMVWNCCLISLTDCLVY